MAKPTMQVNEEHWEWLHIIVFRVFNTGKDGALRSESDNLFSLVLQL